MKNISLFFLSQAIGIIGGADGNNATALTNNIFLQSNILYVIRLLGGALILSGLFLLVFKKDVKKNCSLKTSGTALAVSTVLSLGLYCARTFAFCFIMTHPRKHPISLPVSIILGVLCLIALILLLRIYFKIRTEKPSVKGVIIDILFATTYVFPLFSIYQFLHHIISGWIR